MAKGTLPLLFILILSLASCLQVKRNYLSKEEIGWLRENGDNLEVLFGYEAPPDAFTNSLGSYDGLLVDYFRELESTLGFTIPMRIFPAWSDIMEYSRTGKNYIIFGIVQTEDRDGYLLFTDPFYRHRFDIITSRDSALNSLEDLRGRKFAVVQGYAIGELLERDYPYLDPIPVENDLVGLRAVKEGAVDAFVTYELYGKFMADTQGISDLRMIPVPQYNVEYRIAVSRSDPVLRDIMDKTLARIGNRRKRELDLKWNSLGTTKISRQGKILLYTIPALLALVTAFVFIWLFFLRREVERKTRIIRESEGEYRLLAQDRNALLLSIPDGMAITDGEGRIGETNGAFDRLLGLAPEDIRGKGVIEILPFLSSSDYLILKNQSELMRSRRIPALSCRTAILSPREEERFLSISGAPVPDGEGRHRGYIWIIKDITDQSMIEDEFLRARKGESLAVLAGGITHDLNNLLTCLYGYIDLALLSLDEREETRENLENALDSLDNARNLTGQMLTFSRGGEAKKELVQPAALLSKTARFSLRGRNVTLIEEIPENLPPLYVDRGQLSQVISNLVINAAQAMGDSGEIRLAARMETGEEQKFLRISVRDRGPGIPRERQEEIFRPYFTTKKEGNGLGLASCRIIISRHNGRISLNSEPGEGAEFIIHLPVYDSRDGVNPMPEREGKVEPSSGPAEALIMEPDREIGQILTRFLKVLGYGVRMASSPREALRLFTESAEGNRPVGLVIADVSGEDELCRNGLAREMRNMGGNVLIIGASASPEQSAQLKKRECAYDHILIKPFSYEELSRIIGKGKL